MDGAALPMKGVEGIRDQKIPMKHNWVVFHPLILVG